MRDIEVRPVFWERYDAEYEHLCERERLGLLSEGTAARWAGDIEQGVLALAESAEQHPLLRVDLDPDENGYRSSRVDDWRIVYRFDSNLVVVLVLWHVRQRPGIIIDR